MSIVARYAFEDNLSPSIGGNLLTYSGGSTPPTESFEDGLTNLSRCYRSYYDATSLGFYFVPSNLGIISQSSYSLSFWAKFVVTETGEPGTIARMFASNDSAGLDYSLQIVINSEDNSLSFFVQSYEAVSNNGNWNVTKITQEIRSNQNTFYLTGGSWHLITITQELLTDAQNIEYAKMCFYIDGVKTNDDFIPYKYTYTVTTYYGSYNVSEYTRIIDDVYFQKTNNSVTIVDRFYFGGANDLTPIDLNIDELRIYNNVIPTDEIYKIYNFGFGRIYTYPTFISLSNVPETAYIYKDFNQINYLEPPLEVTLLDKEGIQSFDYEGQSINFNYYFPNIAVEKVDPRSTKTVTLSYSGNRTNYNFIQGNAKLDCYFTANLVGGETLDVRLKYFIPSISSNIDSVSNINSFFRPNYVGSYDINGEYQTNDIVSYQYERMSNYYIYYLTTAFLWSTPTSVAQAKRNIYQKEPTNFVVTINLNNTTVNIANNTIYIDDERFAVGSGVNSYLGAFNSTFVKIEGASLPTGLIGDTVWNSTTAYQKFDIVNVDGIYFTCMIDNLNENPIDATTMYIYGNEHPYWKQGIYKFIVGSYGGPRYIKLGKYNGSEQNLIDTGAGTATFTFYSLSSNVDDNVNWQSITSDASINVAETYLTPTFYSETITLEVDTRTLANTTLFIHGKDFYETPLINSNPSSGLMLVAQLPPDIINSTTLFVYGALSEAAPLFIQGHSTQINPSSTPTTTLFVRAYDSIQNNRDLYISGEPTNISIPLFLKVQEPIQVTNNIPLNIFSAGVGIQQIINSTNLYINGSVFNATMNLFIEAVNKGNYSANMNMFLKSDPLSTNNSMTLFLSNLNKIESNSMTLSLESDQSGNAFPINQSMNLYIEKIPGTANTTTMYIHGQDINYNSTTLFISNNLELNNNMTLAIPFTEDLISSNRNLYIRGR